MWTLCALQRLTDLPIRKRSACRVKAKRSNHWEEGDGGGMASGRTAVWREEGEGHGGEWQAVEPLLGGRMEKGGQGLGEQSADQRQEHDRAQDIA